MSSVADGKEGSTGVSAMTVATIPHKVFSIMPFVTEGWEADGWKMFQVQQPVVKWVGRTSHVYNSTLSGHAADCLPFDSLYPTLDPTLECLATYGELFDLPSQETILWREPAPQMADVSLLGAKHEYRVHGDYFEVSVFAIEAFWSRSTINMTNSRIGFELENIDDDLLRAAKPDFPSANKVKHIAISPEWAQRLWASYLNATFGTLGETFSQDDQITRSEYIAKVLALGISDAPDVPSLNHQVYRDEHGPWTTLSSSCAYDPSSRTNCTPSILTITEGPLLDIVDGASRKVPRSSSMDCYTSYSPTNSTSVTPYLLSWFVSGQGYSSSTTAIRLSLSVLLVYCLYVFTYLCCTVITGRAANSWNTNSEMLMLGICSKKPEHLMNTSVGINTLATFREPVQIRVNEDDGTELSFANDPGLKNRGLRMVEVDEKY